MSYRSTVVYSTWDFHPSGTVTLSGPALLGTTRDRHTRRRRAYIRFFACNEDWSDASPDDPLPDAVASGKEPFIVIGAMSGG